MNDKIDLSSLQAYKGKSPKLGEIGCYLSHLHIWKKFLESDHEFALIFEDDVSFDPHELKIAIDDLLAKRHLWDIVNLNNHYGRYSLPIDTLTNDHTLVLYFSSITSTGAYLINREAARKLIAKALPIKLPVDIYFSRLWEFGIKFTGVENPTIVRQTFGDSEINISNYIKKDEDEKLGVKKHLIKKIYTLQSNIARILYNAKLYLLLKTRDS